MRLIDADRLKAEIMGWYVALDDREIVLQAIEESPTIDAVERCIYCGNQKLEKMDKLEPEESEELEC